MGFYVERNTPTAATMKTKRKNVKKPTAKHSVKKRSVGRPRKTKVNIQKETLSDLSVDIPIHKDVNKKTPIKPVQIPSNTKPVNLNSAISEHQVCIIKCDFYSYVLNVSIDVFKFRFLSIGMDLLVFQKCSF